MKQQKIEKKKETILDQSVLKLKNTLKISNLSLDIIKSVTNSKIPTWKLVKANVDTSL